MLSLHSTVDSAKSQTPADVIKQLGPSCEIPLEEIEHKINATSNKHFNKKGMSSVDGNSALHEAVLNN